MPRLAVIVDGDLGAPQPDQMAAKAMRLSDEICGVNSHGMPVIIDNSDALAP